MSPFKLAFYLFMLIAVSTQTFGLEEGDIDGAIGHGRDFILSSVDEEEFTTKLHYDSADCCMYCEKKYNPPGTQMVNFKKQFERYHVSNCQCLKHKLTGERPVTVEAGSFTGVCTTDPPIRVKGGVGYEREFRYESVEDLGYEYNFKDGYWSRVGNVTNHGLCCQLCQQKYPATQMYKFDVRRKKCNCYQTIRGKTPATWAWKNYAEICDMYRCPKMTIGDNYDDNEIFIQESEITEAGCQDTCQRLYPNSVGITESRFEKYGNGQNKCWCEFGVPYFSTNKKYQTCLFKSFSLYQIYDAQYHISHD